MKNFIVLCSLLLTSFVGMANTVVPVVGQTFSVEEEKFVALVVFERDGYIRVKTACGRVIRMFEDTVLIYEDGDYVNGRSVHLGR